MDIAFIEELASASPTPGGGGASAYGGALASALASMVGNLTVGKKAYAAVEDQMQVSLRTLESLRGCLLDLVEADGRAFEPLAAAYRMPKATPEERAAKESALQAGLVEATEVPLSIMQACVDVLQETKLMADSGSRMAVSDAGVAAVFAKAALQGASLNVRINLASMADEVRVVQYRLKMDELLREGEALADGIYRNVVESL